MQDFRDPTGVTRAAVAAVWVNMVLELLFGLLSLYSIASGARPQPDTLGAVGIAAIASFAALLTCLVLVGRWIYRTNANAHALSSEMTITPGWAVGWYFIPIANLFKPFQAMKETWLASHYRGNFHGEPVPSILGWWWGLWITHNILINISFRLSMQDDAELAAGAIAALDGASALLNVPLSLLLIRIMKSLSEAQLAAFRNDAFA